MSVSSRSLLAFFLCATAIQSVHAAPGLDLSATENRTAYTVGLTVGENLRDRKLAKDALLEGISDGIANSPKIAQQERQEILMAYQKKMQESQFEAWQAQGDANLKKSAAFLEKNAKEKGIVSMPNGLQYRVLRKGTGTKSPKATDTVKVHYKGTLIDGKEFDSSYSRNEPATFPLNRVIQGWTDGLQLMKVGDKWELFIPSHLGYGTNGAPPNIGPNEVLIFEVELLEIK
jgi:FKBP-type peptidyl-prolyl cis-trans isomerase FklB